MAKHNIIQPKIGLCKDCIFWEKGSEHHGKCHRYPPAHIILGSDLTPCGVLGKFTVTEDNYYCGEFKQR